MAHALSTRRTLIGSMLRQYRENLGYHLDDAARILECDRSKISRIETGQRGIRPFDLRALLTEYGIDASTQETLIAIVRPRGAAIWQNNFRTVLGEGYFDFVVAEAAASHIEVYAPLYIPDLLQTEAYAEAIIAADATVPEDQQSLRVESLVTRQVAITHERCTDLTVVIGEAALRHEVGGTTVLREQLSHLAELVTEHDWLTIQLLPFTAGAHAASSSGGFSLLGFEATPALGLIYLSGPGGGICLDDAAATSEYRTAFQQVSMMALSPEQSAEQFQQIGRRQR